MLRKKVFLYVSFVKSVQFVCAIIVCRRNYYLFRNCFYNGRELWSIYCELAYYSHFILPYNLYYWIARSGKDPRKEI